MKRSFAIFAVALLFPSTLMFSQPTVVPGGIRFTFSDPSATTLSLVGDFNAWSGIAHPMKNSGSGSWSVTVPLLPGTYQYAFLVDNSRIMKDPNNSLTFEAIDGSRINSMLTLSEEDKLVTIGYPVRRNLEDTYEKKGGTVYLNLIFKHHVPLYYNPGTDQIEAPFVRMHATRDYFEMGDVIQRYPNVHATVALSPTLLWQIEEIYVKRLKPFIKKYRKMRPKSADMNAAGFLASMRGKTDPWIDAALTPAENLSENDKAYLYKHPWNTFTISTVRLHRFPELLRLYEKWKDAKGIPDYSIQELRTLKFFAIFAHFDTEFYERRVPLIQTGSRINLSLSLRDLISYRGDGKYYLKREVTEKDCRRIVASVYYVLSSIRPNFEKVKYDNRAKIGQLELAATSFSDAILPLVINSDVAKTADPSVELPPKYARPEDADLQLKMALSAYQKYFNTTPTGYIPPYGAVSPEVIPILKKNGFQWFSSDEAVLKLSKPGGLAVTSPYNVKVGEAAIAGVFSNNLLAMRANWVYRNYYAENAANDFIEHLLSFAPSDPSKEALVTVVFENDDAWMHYYRDTDGKGLINGIYRKINKLFDSRTIISTTVTEYLSGNRQRGIPAHKASEFKEISTLGSGSSVEGNFSRWIGSRRVNTAWTYLGNARSNLGSEAPVIGEEYLDNFATLPYTMFLGAQSREWYESFGSSSVLGSNPKQFEQHFLMLLDKSQSLSGSQPITLPSFIPTGELARTWEKPKKLTRVTFLCKLVDREAITSVFIAGNRKELSNLEPNTTRTWDNGENGDELFGNNVWTLVVDLEPGDLLYKFTNSGGQGTWDGSEAFPDVWRKVKIEGEKMTLNDIFARLKPR